jgi:hypothetical protein
MLYNCGMRAVCGLCALRATGPEGAETVDAIDAELRAEKISIRGLETQSGWNRGVLWRHKQHLPKIAIAAHKDRRKAVAGARVVVQWPGHRFSTITTNAGFDSSCKEITEAELRPDDLLLKVTWEAHPIGNFPATQWAAATQPVNKTQPTSQPVSGETMEEHPAPTE